MADSRDPLGPVPLSPPYQARADASASGRRGGTPPQSGTVEWADLTAADNLPALTDSFSMAAEQFRMLRARLDGAEGKDGRVPQVLAFTSAMPGEGKTCTALNTAITAAQDVERRVVFVECDLRRQRVGKLLESRPEGGLAEVLDGKLELSRALLRMRRPPGLSLLLAGGVPTNPVELLGSDAMARLVDQLREEFDLVILDTPPALAMADASRLGPMVDAYVLVVRAGRSPRDAVVKTYRNLVRHGVAGVVLNDLGPGPGSGYGYYYQAYRQYTAHRNES